MISDEQVDAALEVWFKNWPAAFEGVAMRDSNSERMRAALAAAASVTRTEQRTRVHQLRDTILRGERLAGPAWEALHELVCLAGGGP
jgi:hypothetical protein